MSSVIKLQSVKVTLVKNIPIFWLLPKPIFTLTTFTSYHKITIDFIYRNKLFIKIIIYTPHSHNFLGYMHFNLIYLLWRTFFFPFKFFLEMYIYHLSSYYGYKNKCLENVFQRYIIYMHSKRNILLKRIHLFYLCFFCYFKKENLSCTENSLVV